MILGADRWYVMYGGSHKEQKHRKRHSDMVRWTIQPTTTAGETPVPEYVGDNIFVAAHVGPTSGN